MKRFDKVLDLVFAAVAVTLVVRGLLSIEVSNSTLAVWVGVLGVRSVVDRYDQ